MTISERIFKRADELKLSQAEISRRTGIAISTVNDWKLLNKTPTADKLVKICKALDMTLEELLCDEDEIKDMEDVRKNAKKHIEAREISRLIDEEAVMEFADAADYDCKKRMLAYMRKIVRKADIEREGKKDGR